jgi:hypothetical protein
MFKISMLVSFMATEEVNIKEHLNNLIEVLMALSPSRNYVAQFLMMLPQDYPTLYDAYPEILKDEETRNMLQQVFGTSIGANIDVGYGLGNDIKSFIGIIFTRLEDDKVRSALSEFLKDVRKEPVSNLRREWAELRLKGVSMEPTFGKDALRVFRLLAETKEPSPYRCDFSDIVRKTGINESTMRRIIDLLFRFRLIEGYGRETYSIPSEIQKYVPELIKGIV